MILVFFVQVLKPLYLRTALTSVVSRVERIRKDSSCLLTVTLISGHYLQDEDKSCPMVYVETIGGVKSDRRQFKANSDSAEVKGLSVCWDDTFQFPLVFPNLAILRFKVRLDNGLPGLEFKRSSFEFNAPVSMLREGFRVVPLSRPSTKRLDPSFLFVKVSRRPMATRRASAVQFFQDEFKLGTTQEGRGSSC